MWLIIEKVGVARGGERQGSIDDVQCMGGGCALPGTPWEMIKRLMGEQALNKKVDMVGTTVDESWRFVLVGLGMWRQGNKGTKVLQDGRLEHVKLRTAGLGCCGHTGARSRFKSKPHFFKVF